MAPKYHYPPISGGDRKALAKELSKSRAMTKISQSARRRNGESAINGGYPWLEIECSRCKTPRDVDLCALRRPPTTFVHDLAGLLVCLKCKGAGKRPAATLLQLTPRSRHAPANESLKA